MRLEHQKTLTQSYWEIMTNWIHEISINYSSSRELYDHSTTIVKSYFSTVIAQRILTNLDWKTMAECKKCSDLNKWKEAIEVELSSLRKRKLFTNVIPTPPRIFPVGFKWVFIQKQNENNEVLSYKARLVEHGFTQRSDIEFNETYSPVMNEITFWYLISLQFKIIYLYSWCMSWHHTIVARLGYLYEGSDGISVLNMHANHNMHCVKLTKTLCDLKQPGWNVVQPIERVSPK
jgi:hypothetical protein